MRELETSLRQFGEFVLKAQLVKEKAARYVRWVGSDVCPKGIVHSLSVLE